MNTSRFIKSYLFPFNSFANLFECYLIIWFTASIFLCLQDQGSAFFIIWEEFINISSIALVVLTLSKRDNGNPLYISVNILMLAWFLYALKNDSTATDIGIVRQVFYVMSDVAMCVYTSINIICSYILFHIKARSDDEYVSYKTLVKLSPMYRSTL